MHRKRILSVLIITTAAGFLTACSSQEKRPAESGPVLTGVQTETVRPESAPQVYQAVGTVHSANTAMLAAQVGGTVREIRVQAGDRVKRGLGLELTISGARPQQNNYLLDGVNINDYANAGPGSVLGGNLGTDAVAEFSVLTTNYSTEYGRTSGGIVTATTKSGTNQFHGSAYE